MALLERLIITLRLKMTNKPSRFILGFCIIITTVAFLFACGAAKGQDVRSAVGRFGYLLIAKTGEDSFTLSDEKKDIVIDLYLTKDRTFQMIGMKDTTGKSFRIICNPDSGRISGLEYVDGDTYSIITNYHTGDYSIDRTELIDGIVTKYQQKENGEALLKTITSYPEP
jgi:hypothetical protein